MSNFRRIDLGFLLLLALFLLRAGDALAFSSALIHTTEEFGKREVLAFALPPGAEPPRLQLLEDRILRLTIPDLLALPMPEVKNWLFIESVQVEAIPGGQMGLLLTITLKKPYLHFRDVRRDDNFRLELEEYPIPTAVGPTRLLEGQVLAGRDATLVVLSYTGHGWVESAVDYGDRVVRLSWQGASLDQGWQRVKPAGLAERILDYNFPRNLVEMEIALHPNVATVHFQRNSAAGTLIIELRTNAMVGRELEAGEIIRRRQESLAKGQPEPLNRLAPVFVNASPPRLLAKAPVDEAYFYNKAKEAERNYDFAQARAYLTSMMEVFPDSINRELVDFYRVELASRMDWKPGWVMAELEEVLARWPNTVRYPEFRLMQLKLLNLSGQYENAYALMTDPNLPKDEPAVLLERGRTTMGLRRWEESARHLREVFAQDRSHAEPSAEANYLLAKLAMEQELLDDATNHLDSLSEAHLTLIANHPQWIKDVADIYFANQLYDKSLHYYGVFLNYYHRNAELAPWVILRAAESRRHLDDEQDALNLYHQLLVEYPQSDAAIWARIFKLQLEQERKLEERLDELDKIVAETNLTEAIIEAQMTRAVLLGSNDRHRESLETLNKLLTLTLRDEPVNRAKGYKHEYLVKGMKQALEKGRPEYAVLLAEVFGEDWRKNPEFKDARLHLAEALLRMGAPDKALEILKEVPSWPAPELVTLGQSFVTNSVLASGETFNSKEAARVRLDQAKRLAMREEWEGVLLLLDNVSDSLLTPEEQANRLRLVARAEAGRGRFPQAVGNLEKLLYDRPIGDGLDYYWYATLMQMWKGDIKSLDAFRRVAKEAENKEVQALARMRVGDILQRNGELDAAQQAFREVPKVVPASLLANVSSEIAMQLEMVK